jgi:nicotinamide/nicotinate riboside kinase
MPSRTLILSLSGPSSSGKTTLARLLRSILNTPPSPSSGPTPKISSFILHEDDFYVTDALIPIDPASGLADWDCLESIDVEALVSALCFIKTHGRPPDELVSKEDQNEVGDSGVDDHTIEEVGREFRARLSTLLSGSEDSITVAIIDGFLLYAPPESASPLAPLLDLLDIKLFLRTTQAKMRERREKRKGYVTLEGFWEDPEGYVERIVWPNYVRDHKWIFEGGDVDEGAVRGRVGELGVRVAPGKGEVGMEGLLRWGVGVLGDEVERISRGKG